MSVTVCAPLIAPPLRPLAPLDLSGAAAALGLQWLLLVSARVSDGRTGTDRLTRAGVRERSGAPTLRSQRALANIHCSTFSRTGGGRWMLDGRGCTMRAEEGQNRLLVDNSTVRRM